MEAKEVQLSAGSLKQIWMRRHGDSQYWYVSLRVSGEPQGWYAERVFILGPSDYPKPDSRPEAKLRGYSQTTAAVTMIGAFTTEGGR